MPRPVAWLLLILAFSAPLLTHAEAADDLGRSLIGPGECPGIAPPDGGVADDPIVVASWKSGPTAEALRPSPLPARLLSGPVPALPPVPSARLARPGGEGPPGVRPPSLRRHLRLRHFLI